MTRMPFDEMTVQEMVGRFDGSQRLLGLLGISADDQAMVADVAGERGWPPGLLLAVVAAAGTSAPICSTARGASRHFCPGWA